MANHTPGRWDARRDATPDYAPQYTVYSEESGIRVATAFDGNAALIAAAPDMLEALELTLERLIELQYGAVDYENNELPPIDEDAYHYMMSTIECAIAHAKGEGE